MKIIIYELLGMIKDEPDKSIYIKYFDRVNKKEDVMWACKENIFYKLNQLNVELNDKVEILEEEKKIPEKYDTGLHNGRWTRDSIKDGMEKDNMSLEDIVIEMGKEQTLIKEKLFEILDYLKSKGE